MRHGPPLQGDLQGEPGRDPEVHHQGADHALSAVRGRHPREPFAAVPAFFRVLPVLPIPWILLALGCAAPPRDGLIVYREPVPPTGFARKGKLEPVTQIVTTGDKELAEDIAVESRSGVVEGLGDTRSSSDADSLKLAEKIFERSRRSPTRVLTREKFGELWSLLEEAGIFDLPPNRGPDPPKDRPYFILESQGSRVIVGRPQVSAPSPEDPGVQLLERWNSSKLTFFNFLNNP